MAPWAAKRMKGLLSENERILYTGQWNHGFFSLTAVGAYNVGSVEVSIENVSNFVQNVKVLNSNKPNRTYKYVQLYIVYLVSILHAEMKDNCSMTAEINISYTI